MARNTFAPASPPPTATEAAVPYAFENILKAGGGLEIARLEAQNALLERHGLLAQLPPVPSDGDILDVGSGTGYWSLRLAARVPRGRVHCLDRSAELLGHVRSRLEAAGIRNAGYLHQDLRDLDLPPDTFDLAFTSVTLTHVVAFEAVLDRIVASLKPGGWIACFEPVQEAETFAAVHPPCEHLQWIVARLMEELRARGTDFSVGFKIARHLEGLGLEDVSVRYFGEAPCGPEARHFVEDIFLPIARAYLAGDEEFPGRLGAALEESRRPGLWINLKRTVIQARKPA